MSVKEIKALIPFQEFKINSEEQEIPKISYETDISTIQLNPWSPTGTMDQQGWVLTTNDEVFASIYISGKVDPSRKIIFTLVWYMWGGLIIDGELTLIRYPCDGETAGTTIDSAINYDITFIGASRHIETTHTIALANVIGDCHYLLGWVNKDADNIILCSIQVEYFKKRSFE